MTKSRNTQLRSIRIYNTALDVMKRREIYFAIFLLFLIGNVSGEQITDCMILDKENTVYTLYETIFHSGKSDCLIINASNITIDCKNNSIISSSEYDVAGIFSGASKTKIKNCYVREFKNGSGIYLKNSDESIITDNIIKKNKNGLVLASKNVRLAYNVIELNTVGIKAGGENNIINNNNICFNSLHDVECQESQAFENNICDSGTLCGGRCFKCTANKNSVYDCRDFKIPDMVYTLEADLKVQMPGGCFRIYAENVTLDCQNHTIAYELNLLNYGEEFLIYSKNNYTTIKNCIFQGTFPDLRYTGNAMELTGSYSHITGNKFNKIKHGILITSCEECIIEKNDFNSIEGDSININNANKNVIRENKLISVTSAAIKILGGRNSEIKNNYIEGAANAIEIENKYSRIEKNTILNTKSTAINVKGSEYSIIQDNSIENCLYGINIVDSSGTLAKDNTLYSASIGILVEKGEDIKIIENNVGGSEIGFMEKDSALRIEKNFFCGNNEDVECSSENKFNYNQCSSGRVCGGKCQACGLPSISLWARIKQFFMGLF